MAVSAGDLHPPRPREKAEILKMCCCGFSSMYSGERSFFGVLRSFREHCGRVHEASYPS